MPERMRSLRCPDHDEPLEIVGMGSGGFLLGCVVCDGAKFSTHWIEGMEEASE